MSDQACIPHNILLRRNPITDPINTCYIPPASSAFSPALDSQYRPLTMGQKVVHIYQQPLLVVLTFF